MSQVRSWLHLILAVVVITMIVSIGYGLIYASNPYMELASLAKTVMGHSMLNRTAPDFSGIDAWINSSGLSMKDLRGQVVLVDFWTYSCINCQRDLPYVVAWDKKYREQGLTVVGIHTPEFRFEQKLDNVQAAVNQYGIEYPVALDNNYQTWRAFNNHYWPAKYLIDQDGNIVFFQLGEGGYEAMEAKIKDLLSRPTSYCQPGKICSTS